MTEKTPTRFRAVGRGLLTVGLSLAALAVGAGAFFGLASLKQPPAARDKLVKTYNVEVFDVEPANLREVISAFGTARADREVVVAAQVAGTVVELHPRLKVGQTVRAGGESERIPGDLLARIDPRSYRERVTQAERRIAEDEAELQRLEQEQANNEVLLEQAEQDVRDYRSEYDRIKGLADRGVATPNDLTRVKLELQRYEAVLLQRRNDQQLFPVREEQLRRRMETNRSELEMAKLDLNRTEVRPPFDGVLSEVLVDQGQYVRVGDPLVRLTDTSVVEIPVPLTLDDFARLKPQLRESQASGEAPSAALADNETSAPRWSGRLVRIAPEADELTRTIMGYVVVDNSEQAVPLLPGTFVNARIDGPVLENITVVPRDAIVEGRVFVATADGTAEQRAIEVDRTLQTLAVVSNGVSPGQQVILTNLDVIYDQARVNVQSHRDVHDELSRSATRAVVPAGIAGTGGADSESMN